MTGPARNPIGDDDEARWAEAQSILDRHPTESADKRLHRAKRLRWLLVLGLVLLGLVLALLFALLVFDPSPEYDRPGVSTWQAVTGLSISGLGIVLMLVALVFHFRRTRRARGWSSPMYLLTRRQRKELLKQVRGQAPAVPERVPLARHLAELLLLQRLALAVQAGMLVNFAGLWIADRATYRLVFVGILAVLLLVGAVLFRREDRRARRFLAEHPDHGSRP